jgi:DNA primase|tara:strand:- start:1471 stop:2385 length:915 start_codon:yes stop_codon:yes gene_type:complete
MEDPILLIELLHEVLGEENSHYPNKGQISFDCPVCSYDIKGLNTGDGKGNFEVNYYMGVYKCWSCSETMDTHGSINKLFNKWGNRRSRETWKLIGGDFIKKTEKKYQKVKLPKEYTTFKNGIKLSIPYKEAYNYLRKRGLSDDTINKFKIGYVTKGQYSGRIIVPSYDVDDELNYFVSRSYTGHKNKYKNPEAEKDKIIFNEHLINWEEDIYLVEGVFDMFFVENSIPILGKSVSEKLWTMLYDKSQKNVIICLDGDAWEDAQKLYRKLEGGRLMNKVKLIKLPIDKDVGELGGIKGLKEITLL